MSAKRATLTRSMLKAAADESSWERGERYFEQQRVQSLVQDGGVVAARVMGSQPYRVKLRIDKDGVEGECSCPMGDDGVFCKHCVAVGLAFLAGDAQQQEGLGKASRPRTKNSSAVTMDDVRKHLAQQPTAKLVDLIVAQAMNDDGLRRSLLMDAALRRTDGADLATFRQAIRQATDAGDFVEYGEARDFVQGIESVAQSLAALARGRPAEAVELIEYALERCEDAIGNMDDSSGDMSGMMAQLADLHHAACLSARPDPEDLARRLFAWETQSPWETFLDAAERYADVLGEKGLAVYRRLAQAAWEQLPLLRPGDKGGYDHQRWRVTSIMETLARTAKDVESLVAIKAHDLSLPYHFLQIAAIYQEAGRADKALQWAERGRQEFPTHADHRLDDFIIDQYHRLRRHDEAMEIVWGHFAARPDLGHYQKLKTHAGKDRSWPGWREKAIAHLRQEIAHGKSKAKPRYHWDRPADHSILVEVFLWEKDPEQAWREARAGGCRQHLWLELAKVREPSHPADALAIYQKMIDPLVDHRNNQAYADAAKMVRKIRDLSDRLGQAEQFTSFLAALRTTHKPKRNFMAMLERL